MGVQCDHASLSLALTVLSKAIKVRFMYIFCGSTEVDVCFGPVAHSCKKQFQFVLKLPMPKCHK